MANAFSFLQPMNQSVYLEDMYPNSKQEVLQYMSTYTPPKYGTSSNTPMLPPQLTKDSWYYNSDGRDDGKISLKEKVKAFVKGGTYNMIRGLFCDKDGFSFKRTLTTAVAGTALALTGPVGAIFAGGLGLIAGVSRFATASEEAKRAVTDQQAREAYEGFGEGTALSGLSLFGGFKGLKAIKNNFAFAKAHPNMKVGFWNRFLKWNAGKYATLKPGTKNPDVAPTPKPVDPAPSGGPAGGDSAPTTDPVTPVKDPSVSTTDPVTPKPTRVRKKPVGGTKKPAQQVQGYQLFDVKEWDGNTKNIDVSIPKDVDYVGEGTPLRTHPDPIGTPTSQNWLP